MTRKVYTTFSEREDAELKRKELEVKLHIGSFQFREPRLLASDTTITKAIELIQASALEDELKTLIITSIEQLETTLAEELDHSLMIRKYNALAAMLEKIALKNTSPEEKEQVFDAFLEVYKEPSSVIQHRAKHGLAIGLVVVVLGLSIAAYYLFPLIHLAALFTMMGVTGTAVTVLSAGTSFVGQFALSILATLLLHKFNEAIYTPLCNGIQRVSQEYRDAASVKDNMKHLLFTTPSHVSDEELVTSPFLVVTNSLEVI